MRAMLKLLLLTTSLLAACAAITGGSGASSSEGEGAEKPEPIVSGEPFHLRVGEERPVEGEDLRLRFVAVVGDSRCPRDVTCVWEGNAEVEIALHRGAEGTGEQATVHLHTHGSEAMPREARALGHTLRLETLDPYPVSTRRIAPEEYVVTLLLS